MKHMIFRILVVLSAVLLSACGQSATPALPENYGAGEAPGSVQGSASNQPEVFQSAVGNAIDLSIRSLDSTPPQDILNEIRYFGGLGGAEYCDNYSGPPMIGGSAQTWDAKIFDPIKFELCGLPVDSENVDIKIEFPDRSSKDNYQMSNSGFLTFNFDTELGDQTGIYHFVFQGNNWSLDQYVNISDITVPSLFLDGNQLIFVKFQPGENVRLFIYSVDDATQIAKLIGWKYVQVYNTGVLIVHTDYQPQAGPRWAFAAIGDISGPVYFSYKGERDRWSGDHIIK